MVPEFHTTGFDVDKDVWLDVALFVQRTVSPGEISSVLGEKEKFTIDTSCISEIINEHNVNNIMV